MREKALDILRHGTVIPATPLALDSNRNINEKHQRLLMQYYLNSGSGGIATAVHSTQFEIRDPKINLFKPVLEIVIDEINKFEKENNVTIIKISGVCGKTEQAVNEAEIAKSYGYDAVLLSPGGLNDLSEDELVERTRQVSKVLPVIGFYLQPSVGGRRFSYSYWEQICDIEGVIAIKAAPFNRYMTLDVMRAAALSKRSKDISMYTGNDDNIVNDLMTTYKFVENNKEYSKEFVGGLLGHWSVWTNNVVHMFTKIKAQKATGTMSKEMMILAGEVTDCNAAFFDTANNFSGCIPGLHEVLCRQGLMEGKWCLNPNEVLSKGQMEEIDRIYKQYPHLNDDDFVKSNINNWKKKVGF